MQICILCKSVGYYMFCEYYEGSIILYGIRIEWPRIENILYFHIYHIFIYTVNKSNCIYNPNS